MRRAESREESYDAISVCGGLRKLLVLIAGPAAVKRFAHYLNDYSRSIYCVR